MQQTFSIHEFTLFDTNTLFILEMTKIHISTRKISKSTMNDSKGK